MKRRKTRRDRRKGEHIDSENILQQANPTKKDCIDSIQEGNPKKRRKTRRGQRKGKHIDFDNIFQQANTTKKKINDFISDFGLDP